MPYPDICIYGAKRTPIGNFQGQFKDITAPELGSVAIKAALEQSGLKPEEIDEVVMGCVLPAGIGQAPARQAALGAGLPKSTGCTTVNKMCGSGLKAIMLAFDQIRSGSCERMVAGGIESMTNAPYLLPKMRSGQRMGHGVVIDHMFYDGLEDSFDHKGDLMGLFAERCAEKFHFTREQQDAFAAKSIERAQQAASDGTFAREIAPLIVKTKTGETMIDTDEGPRTAKLEKVPQLRPAFKKEGTVTAANSSSISDGAAAIVMAHRDKTTAKPLARILGHATFAQDPAWFTTAPAAAIQRLLQTLNWTVNHVDLFEVNEAFAVVPMATMHELKIPHEKMNIYGGACVLGHPVGASGARILVTLLNALRANSLKRGIASLCLGGGEAIAVGVERI